MTLKTPIRDYIYLDIGRLKSIFSQASGGLVETITQSEQTEETMNKGETISESEVRKEILLGAGKLETRVMHDYLFTEVETALGDSIVPITQKSIEEIAPGMFIRIAGLAELDDTKRLLSIAENYNEFFGMIIIVGQAQEIQAKIWELEDQLAKAQHKNQRESIQRQIDNLSPAAILRSLRQGVPQITIDVLKKWISLLYADVFEVKIRPSFDEYSVFRGVLDRSYLRENSTILYAKYGSRTQVAWTMVGQVTTIFDPKELGTTSEAQKQAREIIESQLADASSESVFDAQQNIDDKNSNNTDQKVSNVRDAVEGMYASISSIEEFLMVSAQRKTWIITPLAIYHETPVPQKSV